jgi:hypothetical protein
MSKRAEWGLDAAGLAQALSDLSAALAAYRALPSGHTAKQIVEAAAKAATFVETAVIPSLHYSAEMLAKLEDQRAMIEAWKAKALQLVAPQEGHE